MTSSINKIQYTEKNENIFIKQIFKWHFTPVNCIIWQEILWKWEISLVKYDVMLLIVFYPLEQSIVKCCLFISAVFHIFKEVKAFWKKKVLNWKVIHIPIFNLASSWREGQKPVTSHFDLLSVVTHARRIVYIASVYSRVNTLCVISIFQILSGMLIPTMNHWSSSGKLLRVLNHICVYINRIFW